MPDITKQEAIEKIEQAVADALWSGLKHDEIRAIFTTSLLKKPS